MDSAKNQIISVSPSLAPFHLLELADPSTKQIESYLYNGSCFVIREQSKDIGVCVLTELDSNQIEIKNLAVDPAFQRKGYARQLIQHAIQFAGKKGYHSILIGTGNSSIHQLQFYQKEGFQIKETIKNFFIENYNEPIYENGIQCCHLIMLEYQL
jgi:aminoglycoside 6'-N-acetyltransferase I